MPILLMFILAIALMIGPIVMFTVKPIYLISILGLPLIIISGIGLLLFIKVIINAVNNTKYDMNTKVYWYHWLIPSFCALFGLGILLFLFYGTLYINLTSITMFGFVVLCFVPMYQKIKQFKLSKQSVKK